VGATTDDAMSRPRGRPQGKIERKPISLKLEKRLHRVVDNLAKAEMRPRNTQIEILLREALTERGSWPPKIEPGSAYDPLDAPYLLAVAIYTEVKVSEAGEQTVTDKRKTDGYWGVLGVPAYTQVSGIMLLPKPHLWDLRTERWQPLIVRDRNARQPLPAGSMPLPGFAVSAEGAVTEVQETPMADLVGLPAVWPPQEPSPRARDQRPTMEEMVPFTPRVWTRHEPPKPDRYPDHIFAELIQDRRGCSALKARDLAVQKRRRHVTAVRRPAEEI
jgi:hypothetical protein